jgi:hypothetical protein
MKSCRAYVLCEWLYYVTQIKILRYDGESRTEEICHARMALFRLSSVNDDAPVPEKGFVVTIL